MKTIAPSGSGLISASLPAGASGSHDWSQGLLTSRPHDGENRLNAQATRAFQEVSEHQSPSGKANQTIKQIIPKHETCTDQTRPRQVVLAGLILRAPSQKSQRHSFGIVKGESRTGHKIQGRNESTCRREETGLQPETVWSIGCEFQGGIQTYDRARPIHVTDQAAPPSSLAYQRAASPSTTGGDPNARPSPSVRNSMHL